jgi:PAS domain S-box-containing protein
MSPDAIPQRIGQAESVPPGFLSGGGAMGARIRAHDWAATPLGPPEHWPPGLRTTVRIMLTTGHPMCLFWGADHRFLYNDPYSASLGPEKHPSILGRPGREGWPEVWDNIGPQIAKVMTGGGATWHENHLVPILRNGRIEDVYWTYSYGPVDDPEAPHGVGGALVVCTETTRQVLAERRAAGEADRLAAMFEQAPGFVAMLTGPEHRFSFANAAYTRLVGGRQVVGRSVAEALPEAAEQGYVALLDKVWHSAEPYHAEGALFVQDGRERFVDFIYQPVADAAGSPIGILVQGADVTDRALAETARRRLLDRQEALLRLTRAVMEEDREEAGLARLVFDAVAPLVEADFCVNYRLDEGGTTLALVAAPNAPAGFAAAAATLRLGEAFCGTVAATCERLNADAARIADDPRGALVRGLGGRAYSCHPLLDEGGRLLGTFSFASTQRDRFGEEEVDFLQTVCHFVALAWQRRRGEAALREGGARLRRVLDNLFAFVGLLTPDGTLLEANRAPLEAGGLAPGNVLGRPFWDCFWWSFDAAVQDRLRGDCARALAGETVRHDAEIRVAGDARMIIDFQLAPMRDDSGRVTHLIASGVDVTARRAAEERQRFLLELSDRLRARPEAALATAAAMLGVRLCVSRAGYALVEEGGDMVRVADEHGDGSVPTVADRRLRLDDFGPAIVAELRAGRTLVVADTASDPRTQDFAAAHAALRTRATVTVPLVRDGTLRATLYLNHREARSWTAAEIELVEEVAGRTWATVEQARAEAGLSEGERRLRAALDELDGVYAVAPVGLCVLDTELRYVRINDKLAAINGVSAADHIGRTVREVVPDIADQAEALLRRILETGEPALGIEIVGETPARPGESRVWEENWLPLRDRAGRIVGINITAEDVTERRQAAEALAASEAALRRLNETLEARVRTEVAAREEAQSRLAHAQRMEALGQLAGGIAHDFNNVLQAVQGGARLIEARPGDVERTRRLMGMVGEAAARGTAVTRRLLAFSRRADLRAEPLDAAELLGGVAEVLSHTMGDGIRVEVAAAPDLPPLVADKGQLETVLVNLASNARDAMAGQGVIALSAAAEAFGPGLPRPPVRLAPGEYLRFSVRDSGAGMPPEVLARVTEPFFTTKPRGKGTGLGLAMARGFAEQSGGGLHIESAPGAGTTVLLWLPAAGTSLPADAPRAAAGEGGGPHPDRRARVLLVDDDAVVREIVAEGLRAAGYEVAAAAGAAEALALLDAGGAVDALVSDLSMPEVDGLALVEAVQRRRPGLPAILLTGFATDAADLAMRGAVSGAFSLLRKPIEAATLAERIAALLSGAEASAGGGGGDDLA